MLQKGEKNYKKNRLSKVAGVFRFILVYQGTYITFRIQDEDPTLSITEINLLLASGLSAQVCISVQHFIN